MARRIVVDYDTAQESWGVRNEADGRWLGHTDTEHEARLLRRKINSRMRRPKR